MIPISDLIWKQIVRGIAPLQATEERCKQTAVDLLRLVCGEWPFAHADVAIPRLVQLTRILVERWIQACEVKGAIAPVATQQEATGATSGAEVVVLRKLCVECQFVCNFGRMLRTGEIIWHAS